MAEYSQTEQVGQEVPAQEYTDQTDDEIIAEAVKRRASCVNADDRNRIAAIADLNFLAGDQWPIAARQARALDGRPCLTVNMLPTFLHQVTNDQRMNKPSIKVHPVDDYADIETAKIEQGMIRHIEYDSNADVAYDRAVNSAAAIGFGYWRLVTEYDSPTSWNQKIMFKSIRNALSVRVDPYSTEPDGSDMQFCFVDCLMPRDEFTRKWPKAKACDAGTLGTMDQSYAGWILDDSVLVTEYYCIKQVPDKVVLLTNGESGFKSDLLELPEGVEIQDERDGYKQKVMWYKMTCFEILEKEEIKSNWIPVFPVYGDEVDIEGVVYRSGIVRFAKDPAQIYNVMMTSATEEVSLRAKAPYIMAEGQEEGHEDEWGQANNRAFPYLTYKPVTIDGTLAPPPQRNPMADIPTGFLAMAMHASDNVKRTTGLFDASLGARGTATSGVQERAQQREGDVANYHYYDGLIRTVRHCGRVIASMIPHYYDTERVVRILGEDETISYAKINTPNVAQKKGEDGKIRAFLNNVSAGEFDITVSAGPSFSTLRQEAAEGMAKNMQQNPQLWGVIGDLYVRNQDWPGAEEMAERIKKTIPPNIIAGEDGEEGSEVVQTQHGPVPVAQIPQILAGLEQNLMAAQEALKKADIAKAEADRAEQMIRAQEAQTKNFEAETARIAAIAKAQADAQNAEASRLKAQADVMAAEADMIRARVEVGQFAVNATNPPEPSEPAAAAPA